MRIDLHYFLGSERFWDKQTILQVGGIFVSLIGIVVAGIFAVLQWKINKDQVAVQTTQAEIQREQLRIEKQQSFYARYPSLHAEFEKDSKRFKLTNIGDRAVTVSCVTLDSPVHSVGKIRQMLPSMNMIQQLYDKGAALLLKPFDEYLFYDQISSLLMYQHLTGVKHEYNLNFYVTGPIGDKYKLVYKFTVITDWATIVEHTLELTEVVDEGQEFSKKCIRIPDGVDPFLTI